MVQPNYRRCVSCRKIAPRKQLLRVVRTHPTGKVEFDRGMGRSAYLCPQLACVNSAYKKNRLGRALKTSVPETIYTQLHNQL